MRACAYRDAESLLEDFWREVDAILKKRGIPMNSNGLLSPPFTSPRASENPDRLDPIRTWWDAGFVTQATKLLEEFDSLPDRERSELVAELARCTALASHDGPSDDDLVKTADQLKLPW